MVHIRLATHEDCKTCAELSRIEELKTADGYISERYFHEFVDDDELFLVAEDDYKIVGFVLGEPMKGQLANLGLLTVDQKFRGKGIGKELVESFRRQCDKKGLKYILLYAPKFNQNTLEFYSRCRFRQGKDHVQFLEVRE